MLGAYLHVEHPLVGADRRAARHAWRKLGHFPVTIYIGGLIEAALPIPYSVFPGSGAPPQAPEY